MEHVYMCITLRDLGGLLLIDRRKLASRRFKVQSGLQTIGGCLSGRLDGWLDRVSSIPSGRADRAGISTSCASLPEGRCSHRHHATPGIGRSYRAPRRLSWWHSKKNEPSCLHSWLYEIRWLKVITGNPFFSPPEAAGQTLPSFPSSRNPSVSSCSVPLDSETT